MCFESQFRFEMSKLTPPLFPRLTILNASTMHMALLSRHPSASVIDIPPATQAAVPLMYALPMFEVGEGGGLSISGKKQADGEIAGQGSLTRNVLRGGGSESTDIVFRDEKGGIAGMGLLIF